MVAKKKPGTQLFQGVTPAKALTQLRVMLGAINVVKPEKYRTHDIRRGHALDLQRSGAPLAVILEAGQWSSPAFLKYLDKDKLDHDFVVQAHTMESDSDSGDSE